MKLLLLTDGIYPYVLGGMQKHSYYLSKLLPAHGVEVTLVHCVAFGTEVPTSKEVNKMLFPNGEHHISSICLEFPRSQKLPGHYVRESYKYSVNVFRSIEAILPEQDFIYCKGFAGWHLISQKKDHYPSIGVNFHGYEMYQLSDSLQMKMQHFLLRGPVMYNCNNADFVFSYGGRITSLLTERMGLPEERIIEIAAGVEENKIEEEAFQSKGEVIKLLFVGRYEKRKGVEAINQALKKMLHNNDVFEFHFVGPIPEHKKINSDKVKYHGLIKDYDQIKKHYQACDVLVAPSLSEGMPNVIMEAMANGLAVLTTDVGASSLLVDETNGWLLPVPVKDLYHTIRKSILSLEAQELYKLKKRSLNKIKEFTWQKIGAETKEALLKRVK